MHGTSLAVARETSVTLVNFQTVSNFFFDSDNQFEPERFVLRTGGKKHPTLFSASVSNRPIQRIQLRNKVLKAAFPGISRTIAASFSFEDFTVSV